MAGRKDDNDPIDTLASAAAILIFGPLFALLAIAAVVEAITPALPFLLIVTAVVGIGYAVHRYRTSPFTIRREPA